MFDCIVIGGGVVGTAILDALARKGVRGILIEKEDDVATGASRANSGIVHAGYDCVPNTLKAKFNVLGNKIYPTLCEELDVPYKKTGSLVLAKSGRENELLELLYRANKNGVDARIISRDECLKIEPNISDEIESALWAKDAGIVSPYKLTIAFADRAILNGAEVVLNANITKITFNNNIFTVKTQDNEYSARYLVNSAGSNASYINSLLGDETYNTIYKKGEYYVLDKKECKITNTVLFPLPDERGKGILVAPTADGNVIYGPTSTPCKNDDTSCSIDGLEAVKRGVASIIKNPNYSSIIREYAGVRASVGDDFIIKRSAKFSNFYILAGICSPGLTSAPAIGEHIAEEIASEINCVPPKNVVTKLHHDRLKNLTKEELNNKIKNDERWGRIICRCETITEAEIVNAIHSPLPANTIDSVKRRVRAGMGRCQGGFCAPRVISILSRELGIPITAVKKGGVGSEMVKCRIKEDQNENV